LSGLLTGFDNGYVSHNSQNEQELINKGYGQNVTVYSIINKITTTGANIPLIVWDKVKDEEVFNGKVYESLQQPAIYRGELLSTKEWIETTLIYQLTAGNLYQRKINLVSQKYYDTLEIIPSGIIEPIAPNSYLAPNNGFKVIDKVRQFKIESEELSHLKYINPTINGLNTLKGLAPLQAGLYSLTGSTDVQKALSVLVKNQGVRGLLTNESNRNGGGVNLSPDQAKEVKRQTNNMISGVDKVNSVQVTSASLKYLPMGMSAADLKLIESGVLTDRQLCNIWNVDSKLFNDPSSSTFNNLQTATKGMYNNAILPSLAKIVDDYNHTIVKGINQAENTDYEVRIDIKSIEALQSDQKAEADKDKVVLDGYNVVVNMPISDEGKVKILVDTYGISEELATTIVVPEVDETAIAGTGNDNVQVQSLNGAQVTSMVTIVQAVGAGEMSVQSGRSILIVSFGLSPEEASRILP
jgi:HK97 family phage portal protein